MLTTDQAAELLRELESKLQMTSIFKPNSPELRDARVILFKLRDAPIQAVVLRDKLAALKNWIELLFTNPKLDRLGGVEKVRASAISHCTYLLGLLGTRPFTLV